MPTAKILGKPEMFVDVGSTINITCVVENAPGNVRWMHKEKVCSVLFLLRGTPVAPLGRCFDVRLFKHCRSKFLPCAYKFI